MRSLAPICIVAVSLIPVAGCESTPRQTRGSAAFVSPAGAVTAEPWTFQGNGGVAYTTPHYRVLTTVDRQIIGERLPRFAEASLARMLDTFPHLSPPRKGLEIFVLESRPEWRRFVTDVFGEAGVGRYDPIERGGFTEGGRSVLWDIGVHDTFAIIAHEGWHQFVQSSFREPLPVWLDEGIATWAEGFRWNPERPDEPLFLPWANVERFDQLRSASIRSGLLPFDALLGSRPQELILASKDATLSYYAQAWALTHFLLSDPQRRRSLDRLLADARAGRIGATLRARYGPRSAQAYALRRTGVDVWRAYFGEDLRGAEAGFADYVETVVRPGAKGRIVRGLSPIP